MGGEERDEATLPGATARALRPPHGWLLGWWTKPSAFKEVTSHTGDNAYISIRVFSDSTIMPLQRDQSGLNTEEI